MSSFSHGWGGCVGWGGCSGWQDPCWQELDFWAWVWFAKLVSEFSPLLPNRWGTRFGEKFLGLGHLLLKFFVLEDWDIFFSFERGFSTFFLFWNFWEFLAKLAFCFFFIFCLIDLWGSARAFPIWAFWFFCLRKIWFFLEGLFWGWLLFRSVLNDASSACCFWKSLKLFDDSPENRKLKVC